MSSLTVADLWRLSCNAVLLALTLAVLGQTRYLFELDGVAVGTVELALEGKHYTYTSLLAYRRAKAEHVDEFNLSPDKPVPEGYWLWHKPAEGCVPGVAEVTSATGKLCADEVGVREVKGTAMGKPFTARYDASNELEELVVGKSRFLRTDKPLVPGQPYAKGFPVEGKGKKLELQPPLEGTRWPFFTPKGTRSAPLPEPDSCLEVAQAFVAEHPGYRLVLGVVMDKGRAYPHAWAASDVSGDVDPSAKAPGPKAKPTPNKTYLELPKEQVGVLYVELLEGRRKLVWR